MSFTLISLSKAGKTSLGNCLLGQNEDKGNSYNKEIDLFEIVENNKDRHKYGHLLGQKNSYKILVIDT